MLLTVIKQSEESKAALAHINSPEMLKHQAIARQRMIERLNLLGIKHNLQPFKA